MQEETYKYWAFISYSHRDQAWADWLHKALETYRVPRRLVGRETAAGPVPRRLFPVFRDLEELPSSPNLSGAIDQALQQSRYLIVIASPYAAVSKWVDQEIARFRAMGRGDRILCLIIDGEPHADLHPGKGFLECFPPSLRADGGIEPIAADVRPGKDGKPATKLKLIAGLLGVGLDELRRRERRRRMAQNLIWTAVTVLSVASLIGVWLLQQREKHEALAQQALKAHIETVYENGRQELLAHNQARAAIYLSEAYRLGIETPALKLMLARAMQIVDSEKLSFQTGAPVSDVRFSPDSRLLVTTGKDRIARVWNTETAQKQFDFPVPQSGRRSLPRFSRDSRLIYLVYVASEGASNSFLNVWDVHSGRMLVNLKNPPTIDRTFNAFNRGSDRVAHVAIDHAVEVVSLDTGKVLKRLPGNYSVAGFSRDGRRLFTGSESGEVAMWDGNGERKLRVMSGLHSHIVSLDDTEDGALVAASARDGAIRVWQTSDGALRLVAGHPSPNPSLIFNVDGTCLLTKANDGARIWDTRNGELIYVRQFAGSAANGFDISSSGRWIMSSSSSHLLVQDAQSGADLFTLDGHRGLAEARDFSEDDRYIATGGPDGTVVLWNMPKGAEFEFRHVVDSLLWAAEIKPPGVAASFSHSGALIATGAGDGHLKLWNASGYKLMYSVDADPKSINVLAFNSDDTRLVTGGQVDGVKLWDVSSGQLLREFDCGGKRVLAIAVSSDTRTIAAAILGGTTQLWDAESGALLASFERDEARAGQFSPDGRSFAVGVHGEAKLWNLTQRRFIWSTPLQSDPNGAKEDVAAVDFSADGRQLLVAGYGQEVALLDARSGHVLSTTYEPSSSRFNSVKFREGIVAMGDQNGNAVLWNPDNKKIWILRGHAGEVRTVVFSPNGSFLLTSGADATAKLWDARNGELLDTVAEHGSQMPESPFQAASFSPDGKQILTGSTDGVIRLWEVREESRTPLQVESTLRCKVPWRLEGEDLVPASPDPVACPQN